MSRAKVILGCGATVVIAGKSYEEVVEAVRLGDRTLVEVSSVGERVEVRPNRVEAVVEVAS